jgi:hypothetical protein
VVRKPCPEAQGVRSRRVVTPVTGVPIRPFPYAAVHDRRRERGAPPAEATKLSLRGRARSKPNTPRAGRRRSDFPEVNAKLVR